jgi:hypothetical protein
MFIANVIIEILPLSIFEAKLVIIKITSVLMPKVSARGSAVLATLKSRENDISVVIRNGKPRFAALAS